MIPSVFLQFFYFTWGKKPLIAEWPIKAEISTSDLTFYCKTRFIVPQVKPEPVVGAGGVFYIAAVHTQHPTPDIICFRLCITDEAKQGISSVFSDGKRTQVAPPTARQQ